MDNDRAKTSARASCGAVIAQRHFMTSIRQSGKGASHEPSVRSPARRRFRRPRPAKAGTTYKARFMGREHGSRTKGASHEPPGFRLRQASGAFDWLARPKAAGDCRTPRRCRAGPCSNRFMGLMRETGLVS
jgi:hypothetical protein